MFVGCLLVDGCLLIVTRVVIVRCVFFCCLVSSVVCFVLFVVVWRRVPVVG